MAEPVGDTVVDPPADDVDADAVGDSTAQFRAITTQDEFDRRVQERIARVKSKPPADYEELKKAASRLSEIEEANKTELEKAQTAAATEKAEREKLVAEIRETRLHNAILAEAAKPARKVADPEAAIDFLTGRDKGLLELDDDGNPTNVAKAMDSLLEARPYLVVQEAGTRGSADQGARQSGGVKQVTDAELQTMRPEAIEKARKEGRLNELLGVR